MTPLELQTWLYESGIRDQLDGVTAKSVQAELGVEERSDSSELTPDWSRLLFAGSILARSTERQHLEATLRIATAATSSGPTPAIRDAGAVLFEKISNFQSAFLAAEKGFVENDLHSRLGISLRAETQRRKMQNAVLVQSTGAWILANEFQQTFWQDANCADWVSASAPTASGKTFIVMHWLVDQVRSTNNRVAVYLAPTRALVSEIEASLLALVGDGPISISSVPLRQGFDEAQEAGRRIIYVFTQERLHLLINVLKEDAQLDLLIVDEAHKIGDHQRGVILQDAIERATRINPNLKLVFVSPATRNPEALLSEAPSNVRTSAISVDAPTVLQNLITATQVPRKSKLWKLNLLQKTGDLELGQITLSATPAGVTKKLAYIADAVGTQGGTLVYANTPGEAEKIASLISQCLPRNDSADPELLELAQLARHGVHKKFSLALLVESGVAFHYGNMPSLIRAEIERLFRNGKLRFLVCTSTLIEGVNLSCRTIVVRGPRKGRSNPMEPHDFWNLAGRAGRWGNEFQGNIICIDPEDRTAWPHGVPSRAKYPIKRETDAALDTGEEIATYLENRLATPLAALRGVERFEHIGAYLLSTYLRDGTISNATFARRHSPKLITQLDLALAALADTVRVSREIVVRHPGVSAVGLQALLEHFQSYDRDLENLLPADAHSQDFYDRTLTIMTRVNDYLYPAFKPALNRYHAVIITNWLRGQSLAKMIQRSIAVHEESKRPYQLATLIRGTMDTVEQIARFRAPKYFAAYMDVLNEHLRAVGREDLIDDGLDIGTQLEFGVSSATLLSLLELGLSRMSAVALYELMSNDNLSKAECIEWIHQHLDRLDAMDVPKLIIREVREKTR